MFWKNRKIIVAGSEGLLGKTICEKFEKLGAEVNRFDLSLGDDFTNENSVIKIMKKVSSAEVLINTFALNPVPGEESADLFSISLSSLQRYLDVNLLALFSICREFSKTCADEASIINFTSIYGMRSPKHYIYPESFTKHIGYTITKSGVIGMTKYMAAYLAPRIRVNAIAPGGVFADQEKDFVSEYEKATPMKRMMNKEEILSSVMYLASPESSYTTGTTLVVDGGWTSW